MLDLLVLLHRVSLVHQVQQHPVNFSKAKSQIHLGSSGAVRSGHSSVCSWITVLRPPLGRNTEKVLQIREISRITSRKHTEKVLLGKINSHFCLPEEVGALV